MSTQNFVAPEDVGARVSFQYELPNGYVGEVVGTFQQWDAAADAYVLTDKQGRLVRVPKAGVRYGRIVSQTR
ncbi:MAG: hypothetical protein LC722_04410 [Actinobacteria bacterium]|nr:hypothetical protein [Actinomycetota bacterium]